ncbi:hypothetical protein F5148DRAFT_224938 [Russula earlei]|uniref:Uncharacterized protein n=1 Tax=Russula earlei TaxID=71964 RepID=A0ACC0UJ07_9AGAM|nr:hypothetical protein F5148DRAFT_224938 [Russula earlei]
MKDEAWAASQTRRACRRSGPHQRQSARRFFCFFWGGRKLCGPVRVVGVGPWVWGRACGGGRSWGQGAARGERNTYDKLGHECVCVSCGNRWRLRPDPRCETDPLTFGRRLLFLLLFICPFGRLGWGSVGFGERGRVSLWDGAPAGFVERYLLNGKNENCHRNCHRIAVAAEGGKDDRKRTRSELFSKTIGLLSAGDPEAQLYEGARRRLLIRSLSRAGEGWGRWFGRKRRGAPPLPFDGISNR